MTGWPILVVTQLFGVCFNVGVLATLLLHISLSDVAFGWQSTLHTSPDEAYQLVTAIATPWEALPNAHPSRGQVFASRFAYSAGIAPLSQAAMTSWWPFLCYSVGFYGLLVRWILFVLALRGLRRALAAITFDHHGCNALLRRLTGPVFQAQADGPLLNIPPVEEASARRIAGNSIVMLAEELTVGDGNLAEYLHENFGWTVSNTLSVQIDHPSGNAAALERLAAAPNLASIVVGVPAHRAPIKAIALFLKKVGETSGGAEPLILLFGRKEGAEFGPVSDAEFTHWKNFNAIHGLHFGLEKWRTA